MHEGYFEGKTVIILLSLIIGGAVGGMDLSLVCVHGTWCLRQRLYVHEAWATK